MKSFQEFYIYILESNLINFLIMMWLLVFIFKKAKLANVFQKMANDIISRVESTTKATQDILSEFSILKEETQNTPRQMEKIINEAKSAAVAIKAKNDEEIREKVEIVNKNVEKNIENSNVIKKKKLTSDIFNSAKKLAKNHIPRILDKKTQEFLIDDALRKLDEVTI